MVVLWTDGWLFMARKTRSSRPVERAADGSEKNSVRGEMAENVAGNGIEDHSELLANVIQAAMAPVLAQVAEVCARVSVAPPVGNAGVAENFVPENMEQDEVRVEAGVPGTRLWFCYVSRLRSRAHGLDFDNKL